MDEKRKPPSFKRLGVGIGFLLLIFFVPQLFGGTDSLRGYAVFFILGGFGLGFLANALPQRGRNVPPIPFGVGLGVVVSGITIVLLLAVKGSGEKRGYDDFGESLLLGIGIGVGLAFVTSISGLIGKRYRTRSTDHAGGRRPAEKPADGPPL